jgi:hypothetical protein
VIQHSTGSCLYLIGAPAQEAEKGLEHIRWRSNVLATSHPLQVLHCVMWPRRHLLLPIFGLDLLVSGGEVRFLVADMSPAIPGGQLPPIHAAAARALHAQFLEGLGASEQKLPDWARAIMSEHAVAVRPQHPIEADLCVMYVAALMRAYIAAVPPDLQVNTVRNKDVLSAIDAGHRRCRILALLRPC